MNSNPQFLTIEEKRAWLAHVFRDTSGYFTNTEMPTRQPKADNSKTCGTCAYYHIARPNAVMPPLFCS